MIVLNIIVLIITIVMLKNNCDDDHNVSDYN